MKSLNKLVMNIVNVRIYFFVALILVLVNGAFAISEQQYVSTMIVYKENMNVELQKIVVQPQRQDYYREGNVLSVSLYENGNELHKKNLFVNFVGYTQAVNVDLSDITVSVRLPYDSSADTLVIKTANVTKSYIIHDFICNKNNICSGGENHITCPEDCPVNSDGVCINRVDGICDPDCTDDLDCQAVNDTVETPVDPIPNAPNINSTTTTTNPKPSDDPQVPQSNSSYKYVWFAAIAGVILIIVGIIVGKNIKSVGGGDSQ